MSLSEGGKESATVLLEKPVGRRYLRKPDVMLIKW